ncbi:hypothetical protein DIURU_002540 [Diutina rugosa]|uniref:Uncharacterized protein n=1 Tax=Diutina rugosa TaxID=5481 RepID=A0A642UQ49_DIURU|nr:uncharacterized protein DIURU_002540 [Diutina rugosa]KAA8903253.1 hypothetical protein DIURU_002540 [Diutina rugosa]
MSTNILVQTTSVDDQFLLMSALPFDIVLKIFLYLPKNLVLTLLRPQPDHPHTGIVRRPVNAQIKRWLFSHIYVHDSMFRPVLNWHNEELQQWLVLSKAQLEHLNFSGFEWPSCQMLTTEGVFVRWHGRVSRISTTSSTRGWVTTTFSQIPWAINPNMIPSDTGLHLTRLALIGYNVILTTPEVKHRVDSLQLEGRHPGIAHVIDLSSVKQLTVLTLTGEVFDHAGEFTSLTDLFVLIDAHNVTAFSATVRRLVLVTGRSDVNRAASLAANFKLLTYCELTRTVMSFNWPRILFDHESVRDHLVSANPLYLYNSATEFQQQGFDMLDMLVLHKRYLKVVRRDGEWVDTQDLSTGRMLSEYSI